MKRKFPGGRTEPIDPKVRERALKLARRIGVEAAAAKLDLRPGTVRSWIARDKAKVVRAREGEGVLEELKRQGREMLARQEAERAARLPSEPPPPSQPAPKPKRQW
jgi:hypothetical protein